jgi:hypothetical protein
MYMHEFTWTYVNLYEFMWIKTIVFKSIWTNVIHENLPGFISFYFKLFDLFRTYTNLYEYIFEFIW